MLKNISIILLLLPSLALGSSICELVKEQEQLIQQQLVLCNEPTPPPVTDDPGTGVWWKTATNVVFDLSPTTNRTYVPGCIRHDAPASICKSQGSAKSGYVYSARLAYVPGTVQYYNLARAEAGEDSALFSGGVSAIPGDTSKCSFTAGTSPQVTLMDQATYDANTITWNGGSYNPYQGACIVQGTRQYLNITPGDPRCGTTYACRTQINNL